MWQRLVYLLFGVSLMCAGGSVFGEAGYKNGVFQAETRPDYEGYFSRVTITVEKHRIVKCQFQILDANRGNRVLDETYGPDVYRNQPGYRQQCVDNLAGLKVFLDQLVKRQDPGKIDAVTGATWARGKLDEALTEVLKKAKP